MFKIIVLFVLVASACAKPGFLHGVATPVVAAHVAIPTAVSQQSRHDIINPGVITYSTVHAAPVVAAAPVAVAAPLRVSSAATSRVDVRTPVAVGVAGHGVGVGVGVGGFGGAGLGGLGGFGGVGYGGVGIGGGLGLGGHGYGK